MRFYTGQHKHYCGIDLHARSIYVCILDREGNKVLHRNMRAESEIFLKAVKPFSEDMIVGAECMFTWYWLADLCSDAGIPFVLGHALYMKAIHGAKVKNDRVDSAKIAALLRGGTFPVAYVYPREWRSTRDLLRRRLHFVRKRGEIVTHIQNSYHQYNLTSPSSTLRYRANRVDVESSFNDPAIQKNVRIDLDVAERLDRVIRDLENFLSRQVKVHDPNNFYRLRSIPGVGKILAMTLLYEIHDIERFPRVQDFASYSRLVKCSHESAGKRSGTGGRKIGNAYLRWAFGEAVKLMLRESDELKRKRLRLERKHGKGKSLAILAHKLGRAVYFMLKRQQVFDLDRYLAN
ncbi:MAG: IS110 family transposase [Thermodesulfobacteriota bacterium]|nr:IS110 family transposase [Thermodesulfobacteriota bacterium]